MTVLVVLIAIIAHEGPMADGGNFTAFIKQSVFAKSSLAAEGQKDWYKFDDDIVTAFSEEKLTTLAGEGAFLFQAPSSFATSQHSDK